MARCFSNRRGKSTVQLTQLVIENISMAFSVVIAVELNREGKAEGGGKREKNKIEKERNCKRTYFLNKYVRTSIENTCCFSVSSSISHDPDSDSYFLTQYFFPSLTRSTFRSYNHESNSYKFV